MSKWKVYISSTFKDLKDFRAELINLFQNQLQNNFELSKIMERMFDGGTYTPFVKDCTEAVQNCDIYIIILGNKTGSFPPDEDKTYTEFELDTALNNNKKIFCLRLETFNEAEIDNKEKHRELLDKFKGRPTHTFIDVLTLKNVIYDCLFPFSSESPINKKNPYKGLASFDINDSNYFFGRNTELDSCLKKIVTSSGNTFISVIGNSGTGKSSFIKAGLLFRLKNSKEMGYADRPQIIVIPGSEPFTNLKYQIKLQGFSVDDMLDGNNVTKEFILFFDQFEEVITQCQTPEAQEERKQLFHFLDALAANENPISKVLVITSFRSDFLSQLANFDYIKSHQQLFPISSLDYTVHTENWEQSMIEIITRPALKNGVVIEKELVDQMLNDLKKVVGVLPILQFTLERIWNKENIEDRIITSTEYNKMSKGEGISGIIEAHADNVIKNLTKDGNDTERTAVIKSIFINLVEVNENLLDVKRTVSKNELFGILIKHYPKAIVNEIFEALVREKSRLLHISQDKYETINVGIIHEELIRRWERLKGWINERREALEQRKRILLDIKSFNKGEDGLYDSKQLRNALKWKKNNPDFASEEINSFLDNSKNNIKSRILKFSGITISAFVLITTVILTFLQPYFQKREFESELNDKDNYAELKSQINAAGGIEWLKALTVRQADAAFIAKNIKFFNTKNRLRSLDIYDTKLRTLNFLEKIRNVDSIDSLTIRGNYDLNDLKGIESLKCLNFLKIVVNNNLKRLDGIEYLDSLTYLEIAYNKRLTNLNVIEKIKSLKSLTIEDLDSLRLISLNDIKALNSLTSLSISTVSLAKLSGIEALQTLTSLTIKDNNLTTLDGIEVLKNLKYLNISGNSISSLKNIETLPHLTFLAISKNDTLTNLNGISTLQSLSTLTISGISNLSSLNGIEKIETLKELKIFDQYLIPSDNLYNLTHLEKLSIDINFELDFERIEHNNPGVKIVFLDFLGFETDSISSNPYSF